MIFSKIFIQTRKTSTSKSYKSAFRNVLNVAFNKYLLYTNVASSGILMAFGDIAQQEIEYQRGILKKRYDLVRLTQMFTVGLAFGPLHHYFCLFE